MMIKFVGGYKYRFTYNTGEHADYIFSGSNGNNTIWRSDDGVEHNESIFQGVIQISELPPSDKAVNEFVR
jgi:hypothetical protein